LTHQGTDSCTCMNSPYVVLIRDDAEALSPKLLGKLLAPLPLPLAAQVGRRHEPQAAGGFHVLFASNDKPEFRFQYLRQSIEGWRETAENPAALTVRLFLVEALGACAYHAAHGLAVHVLVLVYGHDLTLAVQQSMLAEPSRHGGLVVWSGAREECS